MTTSETKKMTSSTMKSCWSDCLTTKKMIHIRKLCCIRASNPGQPSCRQVSCHRNARAKLVAQSPDDGACCRVRCSESLSTPDLAWFHPSIRGARDAPTCLHRHKPTDAGEGEPKADPDVLAAGGRADGSAAEVRDLVVLGLGLDDDEAPVVERARVFLLFPAGGNPSHTAA
eukprot:CAMPEP_0173426208 /NCGR_PEP_ID=MMETSP1357-20121228/5746_1 /TAXON_ID=77926 /ORGANISM="Hemiselmis rufescens, Strain PCC563" /LENGTH=171 /DNA_ID=CAMNT_0014389825 /DNA_START=77 /DNA_END=593 /DNA_ORIENTATION=+